MATRRSPARRPWARPPPRWPPGSPRSRSPAAPTAGTARRGPSGLLSIPKAVPATRPSRPAPGQASIRSAGVNTASTYVVDAPGRETAISGTGPGVIRSRWRWSATGSWSSNWPVSSHWTEPRNSTCLATGSGRRRRDPYARARIMDSPVLASPPLLRFSTRVTVAATVRRRLGVSGPGPAPLAARASATVLSAAASGGLGA
jgi:hypothetical protein